MSAEMRDFAAAFNKGLDRGVGMAQKREEQAIQHEHNKVLQDQQQAAERHNTRRDDIYAQAVTAAAESNRMKAQAALNKSSGKGGGGAAAAPSNANVDMVHQGALAVGLVPPPEPTVPAAPSVTNNYVQQPESADTPIPSPPALLRKGGMVKKYADGGMSVQEALSYGPRTGGSESKPKETAASSFESNFKKSAEAAAARRPDTTIKNAAPKPTGPVGTGPAGSYTTQDVRPGGVLSSDTAIDPVYRRGGIVKRFAGGGAADLSDPEAAVKSMAYTPGDKNPDGSSKTKDQEDEGTLAQTARASASRPAIDWSAIGGAGGSAGGATGSGGDSTGGVSGTGGVGGSATDGAGGSAAAGVGGDDGGTYRRGGRVRRFQSGGRVMEAAIDTGTSGPGSGYGHRAAPPSRRY